MPRASKIEARIAEGAEQARSQLAVFRPKDRLDGGPRPHHDHAAGYWSARVTRKPRRLCLAQALLEQLSFNHMVDYQSFG